MARWIERIVDYGGSPRTVRGVAGLLLLLMFALGLLQYRWIGQLSEAKRSEMQQALQTSTWRFTSEFHRDLARIYANLLSNRPFTPAESMERHAERFRQWSTIAMHPKLVKRMMIVDDGKLSILDGDTGDFESAEWPADLTSFREELNQSASRDRFFRGGGPPRDEPRRDGTQPSPKPPGEAGPGGPGASFRVFGGVSESIVALYSPRFRAGKEGEMPVLSGWTIAELDLDYIQSDLLPDLVQRHFGENYRIRIVNRTDPSAQIFASKQSETVSFTTPDLEVGLFDLIPQEMSRFGSGRDRGVKPGKGGSRRGGGESFNKGGGPDGGAGRGPGGPRGGEDGGPPPMSGRQGKWLLQAKHESGSLDSAVQSLRYKNLGIVSGILLLMGLTIAAFVASTRRAQQLAQQQMEFVAGISHELRTPLTVICSAGDNLAVGVAKSDAQVKRYGTLVRNEGRRLADMVEQILGYAGIQRGHVPAPKPVDVESTVESALRSSERVLQSRNCEVERHIAPGLPAVIGDSASLSHSVQNLIVNAAKYGGDSPWISVSANATSDGSKVRIVVEDKGPGIEATDLRHIFEPFYRGRKAVDDQIHGTGLGLSLVKRIIEAHSGRVSVESSIGKGSRFILELPAMAREAEPAMNASPETNLT